MKNLALVLVFGFLFAAIGYSQEKSDKNCCSKEKSKTTMSKICDVPDEVSLSSGDNDELTASLNDDKNKKVEKNLKSVEKNTKTDNSKNKSSDDGCCSPDKKKTDKTKAPKS